MTIEQLIAQLNVVARGEFNRAYQSFEPEFKELMYKYPSGPVETMNFPFAEFLKGMEEFTGSRKHQTFPEAYKFTVTNKEWDVAVDIKQRDLERATLLANPLTGLNIYRQRIAEMPMMVKDHPVELAFDMLEAGDANTYGTTFDGQNFFDTTHDYSTSAGTQSNIITSGSGTSVANIITDFQAAMSRLDGFTYDQGGTGNAKKRKLNKTMNRILVVCPSALFGTFNQAMTQNRLANGEDNPIKGKFSLVSRPMTDANDWYITVMDEGQFKPFLFQMEKEPLLDTPTMQDEGVRERRTFSWGSYGRYNVAYGAWWKAIMIQNS